MIQRDLQIVMMRIRRHLRIESVSLQAGGWDGEELIILMPGIRPSTDNEDQEQHDADPGQILPAKPANDYLHRAVGERRR